MAGDHNDEVNSNQSSHLMRRARPRRRSADVASKKIQRFSPWGNKLVRRKVKLSALSLLRETFTLIQFQSPGWRFLRRDKKKEAIGNPWFPGTKANHLRFSPSRDDPFVFEDNAHYDKILDMVKSGIDSLVKDAEGMGLPIGLDADPGDLFRAAMSISDLPSRRIASMVIAELGIGQKFTIQRRVPEYYYINEHSPNNVSPSADDIRAYKRIVETVLRQSDVKKVREFLMNESELADPLDTNSGAPFFRSGPEYRYLNASLYRGILSRDMDDVSQDYQDSELVQTHMKLIKPLVDRIQLIARHLNIPPAAVIGCGSNKRTGPSRKPAPAFIKQGLDLVADYDVTNDVRGRQVFMVSMIYNLLTGPPTQMMTHIRKKIPGFYFSGTFDNDLQAWKQEHRDFQFIESDFSGMDRTYSVPLRLMIIRILMHHSREIIPQWMWRVLAAHPWMPYLIPDFLDENLGSNGGLICVPKEAGAGLYSGLKATSAIDSNGAIIFLQKWLTNLGFPDIICDMIGSQKMGNIFLCNQGDDVLAGFETDTLGRNTAGEIYQYATEAANAIGFKVELIPGDTYLMKHCVPSTMSPLLTRILQQTISNEHIRDTFVIFKLGMLARTLQSDVTCRALCGKDIFARTGNDNPFAMIGARLVEFTGSILDMMSAAHGLKGSFPSLTENRDAFRMDQIRRIGVLMARDELTRNKLQREIVSDRFSTATQQLIDVLSQEPRFQDWMAKESEKEKKLYRACKAQLTESFNLEKFRRTIGLITQG